MLLRDLIEAIKSDSGYTDRDKILRQINLAWGELWNSDDLPNSLFEITVTLEESRALATLPWYVGILRAVKQSVGGLRIAINTPRPYYHDNTYFQSPWTWRVLGKTPLIKTISNATTLTVSIPQVETEPFDVMLIGPTDNANQTSEILRFLPGDTSHQTIMRPTDLTAVTKDRVTEQDVEVYDSADTLLATIPNDSYESLNTVVQITDKNFCPCTSCECFDVLYKRVAPVLYYDETPIHFGNVLFTKTLEWMAMPKEGQEQRAVLFNEKSRALLVQYNADLRTEAKIMDMGPGRLITRMPWHGRDCI